jgi:hypothetical protein
MSMNRLLIVCVLIIFSISFASAESEQTTKLDKYFFAVLDETLKALDTGEYHTIARLYELKEKSQNRDYLLIELLDYYVGALGSVILDEFITERGKEMLPLLVAKKTQPIHCLEKYKRLCMNTEERNKDIDFLMDAIKRGIIIRPEDPNKK